MTAPKEFDYVIVGGGSAGCVLANRLSADPDCRVLVLEAGPMDRSIYTLKMPAAFFGNLSSKRFNWYYHSEPEPHLNGRSIYYPRGRVVGGSSSINGMVFLRGNPLDYDGWAGNALPEWSYAHCLPYFKRMESAGRGADAYRGGDGPIQTSMAQLRCELYDAYVEALQPSRLPLHQGRQWLPARGRVQDGVEHAWRRALQRCARISSPRVDTAERAPRGECP